MACNVPTNDGGQEDELILVVGDFVSPRSVALSNKSLQVTNAEKI